MKINILDKNIKLFMFFACLLFTAICHAEIDVNSSKDISMIKSKGYMAMGTSADFSPFEFLKNGEVTGIDVEIARKIAEKLGVELKIKDTSFNSLIMELNNEEIDFIFAGFTKTEEREKSVDFSDSHFTASQKIVVKNITRYTFQKVLQNSIDIRVLAFQKSTYLTPISGGAGDRASIHFCNAFQNCFLCFSTILVHDQRQKCFSLVVEISEYNKNKMPIQVREDTWRDEESWKKADIEDEFKDGVKMREK